MIFTKRGEIMVDGNGREILADLGVCIVRIFEMMAEVVGDTFTEKQIRWVVDEALKNADHFGDPSEDDLLKLAKELVEEEDNGNEEIKKLKEKVKAILKGVEDNG